MPIISSNAVIPAINKPIKQNPSTLLGKLLFVINFSVIAITIPMKTNRTIRAIMALNLLLLTKIFPFQIKIHLFKTFDEITECADNYNEHYKCSERIETKFFH